MKVHSTSLCYAAKCLITTFPRSFHLSFPQRATKVKKLFTELPEGRILPDGTFAQPLGEWSAGPHCDPLIRCAPLHVFLQFMNLIHRLYIST